MQTVQSPSAESALGARVLLAPMDMVVRLQLRRLLRGVTGIEVVGQAFEAAQIPQLMLSTQANWLLVDAQAEAKGGGEKHDFGTGMMACLVLCLPGQTGPEWDATVRVHRMLRPLTLEAEQSQGAFMQAVIQKLRDGMAWDSMPTSNTDVVDMQVSETKPVQVVFKKHRVEILAMGASTGGPNALMVLLQSLAGQIDVPIVITQHMGLGFTASLAQSLSEKSGVFTHEVKDGELLQAGHAYLAPGGQHLQVERTGGQLIGRLNDGPPECFCRPSVDVMFRSLAEIRGLHVLAVVLTGMGQDGLMGARLIKSQGGVIWAQDEASSIVWGMPGAVAKAGLCESVFALDAMGGEILKRLRSRS